MTDLFWDKWYKAGELERLDILSELPGFISHTNTFFTTTLFNSYLEDLTDYLNKKSEGK
jgi:hypothetical protein